MERKKFWKGDKRDRQTVLSAILMGTYSAWWDPAGRGNHRHRLEVNERDATQVLAHLMHKKMVSVMLDIGWKRGVDARGFTLLELELTPKGMDYLQK